MGPSTHSTWPQYCHLYRSLLLERRNQNYYKRVLHSRKKQRLRRFYGSKEEIFTTSASDCGVSSAHVGALCTLFRREACKGHAHSLRICLRAVLATWRLLPKGLQGFHREGETTDAGMMTCCLMGIWSCCFPECDLLSKECFLEALDDGLAVLHRKWWKWIMKWILGIWVECHKGVNCKGCAEPRKFKETFERFLWTFTDTKLLHQHSLPVTHGSSKLC